MPARGWLMLKPRFSVGLAFDYDLFERAFIGIFDRLRGKQGQFLSSGNRRGGL